MIQFTVPIEPMGTVRMTRGTLKLIHNEKYAQQAKVKAVKKYLSYKDMIGWKAKEFQPKKLITGPVKVKIDFYMPIPQSWSKKKQQEAREGKLQHTSRPDIDNLEKGFYDSVNKILWKDDAQVIGSITAKHYSDNPRIEVKIKEIS